MSGKEAKEVIRDQQEYHGIALEACECEVNIINSYGTPQRNFEEITQESVKELLLKSVMEVKR